MNGVWVDVIVTADSTNIVKETHDLVNPAKVQFSFTSHFTPSIGPRLIFN